jgi:hypothetical protein
MKTKSSMTDNREIKSKPTGFYSLVSFQQVFKLVFKLPFLGKYKIVIKKEKPNRLAKETYKNMVYGNSAGKLGELNGVKFFTSTNIKQNENKI